MISKDLKNLASAKSGCHCQNEHTLLFWVRPCYKSGLEEEMRKKGVPKAGELECGPGRRGETACRVDWRR